MFSKATKTLLKNYIRHTDTHNRMLEESDMWRMHEEDRQRRHEAPRRRAHMDDYGPRKSEEVTPELKRDTFWMKRLQEAEEQDPDRWGHAGYKEMHPEEFNSSLSESSDSESPRNKKHKKKKKTKKKEKKKKSKKKSKMHKKSKVNSELDPSTSKEIESGKSKRAKEHNFSTDSSEDSEYSDSDCERQNNKAKKRKRRNKSYSSSDSDETSDEPKKRQKFTSERPDSANDVKMAGNTTSSKYRKNSKHKKHKSSIGKSDSFGNDVVGAGKDILVNRSYK